MLKNKIIDLSGRDDRALFFLGTASQLPTRRRNPTSTFFRWREHGFLLDAGEGTQRQMFRMGLSVGDVDTVLLSHFHGDHVLGLPGVIQSLSLQTDGQSLRIAYPLSGQKFLRNLVHSSIFQQGVKIVETPISVEGELFRENDLRVFAYKLKHKTPSWGYAIQEDDKVKFDPDKIAAVGLTNNPLLKKITLGSSIEFGGKTISFETIGEKRPGFKFGYVADTSLCPACDIIASGCDVLLCESTYLHEDAETALENGHLTAYQAAQIAARNNVKTLILTHFSQRYQDREESFLKEALQIFPNTIMAEDMLTIYS
jgi:ribonuclease Z